MNERNYKGITLIALVVTIIILLILAGLSIQILSGENGLINRTISAKETTEKAEEKELVELAVSSAQIDGEGTITTDNLNNALKETFNNDTNASENSEGWTYQGKKIYKIYSNGKVEEMPERQSILPNEYQQVEYIESTGEQWINTNFIPRKNVKYKYSVIFKMTDLSKERQTVMGNDTRDIRIESNGYFEGKEVESNFIGFKINDLSIEVIPLQNNNGFLERATVNGNISETNYTWFQENQNIAIFTNLSRVKERLSKARVYRAYVYNDGACIRDFIPCYCTTTVTDTTNKQCPVGTIGLYDTVEGKFYTNQGTVTFLKGNDV